MNNLHIIVESVDVPAIGMTFSRALMPQIDNQKQFLSQMKKRGIRVVKKHCDPKVLKSTQSEFDADKVSDMSNSKLKEIIISKDGYVLDGHHRWLAAHNDGKKIVAYEVDLPILELMRVSKENLHEDFQPKLDAFVTFTAKALKLKKTPKISMKTLDSDQKSFGGYSPCNHEIVVTTKNRHPMDVFRTIAHELVHHKQNEDGKIKDVAKAGATGSPIEDEANSVAGRIMRMYAKENPDMFGELALDEAIFLVGGPCSGKDRILKEINQNNQYTEIDIQSMYNRKSIPSKIIINSSANNYELIEEINELLKENGHKTSMVFVKVSNEISKIRNEQRASKGQRMLSEGVRFSKYVEAERNMKKFQQIFGENMTIKDNTEYDINEQFKKTMKNTPSDREIGTDSCRRIYELDTPGSTKKMSIKKIREKKTKRLPEDGGGGIGATAQTSRSPYPVLGSAAALGGLHETIQSWLDNPKTLSRYRKKYGKLAEEKMLETAFTLEKSGATRKPKTLSSIRETPFQEKRK